MRKRKRSSIGDELNKLMHGQWVAMDDERRKAREYVAAVCILLGIEKIPTVNFCSVSRQNECIRRKAAAPCAGACYHDNMIYLRGHYWGHGDLLHELFHHINALNDDAVICEVMYAWLKSVEGKKTGYRKLLKEAKEAIKNLR